MFRTHKRTAHRRGYCKSCEVSGCAHVFFIFLSESRRTIKFSSLLFEVSYRWLSLCERYDLFVARLLYRKFSFKQKSLIEQTECLWNGQPEIIQTLLFMSNLMHGKNEGLLIVHRQWQFFDHVRQLGSIMFFLRKRNKVCMTLNKVYDLCVGN